MTLSLVTRFWLPTQEQVENITESLLKLDKVDVCHRLACE
jgi:hypothetical protein